MSDTLLVIQSMNPEREICSSLLCFFLWKDVLHSNGIMQTTPQWHTTFKCTYKMHDDYPSQLTLLKALRKSYHDFFFSFEQSKSKYWSQAKVWMLFGSELVSWLLGSCACGKRWYPYVSQWKRMVLVKVMKKVISEKPPLPFRVQWFYPLGWRW